MSSAGSLPLPPKTWRGPQAWGQDPEATALDPNTRPTLVWRKQDETTYNQAWERGPGGVRLMLQVVVWFFKV